MKGKQAKDKMEKYVNCEILRSGVQVSKVFDGSP